MKKSKDSLGDRMKSYEVIDRKFLIPKLDTVIRLDGKAFHTYTKQFERPFDNVLIDAMDETAKYLCETIQGAKFAYVQSDEISIYISDQDSFEQQAWYNGNIQKIVSVAASIATAKFNHIMFINKMKEITSMSDSMTPHYNLSDFEDKIVNVELAKFDARVFQLPNKEEVINCFVWRQQDAIRNSISAVAQNKFSHKELHKKSTKDMLAMLIDKNDSWDNYDLGMKHGRFIERVKYINDIRVGTLVDNEKDSTDVIWYQPENDGLFPSEHGRALQWFENTDSGFPDWCDVPIEKIRNKWTINGALNFVENKTIFKAHWQK